MVVIHTEKSHQSSLEANLRWSNVRASQQNLGRNMKDAEFKALNHPVGANVIASSGSAVSAGYKPDITVKDANGALQFIIESEQKTDRKAFLGDLLKAEMHSERQKACPELIIVMRPFGNTTTKQIADHLRPYKQWLAQKNGGKLNLSEVHVLTDVEYQAAIAAGEVLGSASFKGRGHVV